jgi:hypothetical protein
VENLDSVEEKKLSLLDLHPDIFSGRHNTSSFLLEYLMFMTNRLKVACREKLGRPGSAVKDEIMLK